MKRFALMIALLLLLLISVYLLAPFLPQGWQVAIDKGLSRILPQGNDYSAITHPALDQEIENVLQKNAYLRVAVYVVHLVLLGGTTFLSWLVVKSLRGYQRTK